jgi:hypothetical protein
LAAYDVVNVGAAGTFVVRKPVSGTKFLAELRRKLPFGAAVSLFDARDLQTRRKARVVLMINSWVVKTRSGSVAMVGCNERDLRILIPQRESLSQVCFGTPLRSD